MCGNDWYDFVKHCALVRIFFGKKNFIKFLKVHFYDNDPNKEPDNNDFGRKNFLNTKFSLIFKNWGTLVLLDGCITGTSGSCKATMKVQFKAAIGGMFSNCEDEMTAPFETEWAI